MNKDKLLIWDLDDTLIVTNPEYEKTNKRCAQIISNSLVHNDDMIPSILKMQRKADLQMVKKFGFARARYLQSWLNVYKLIVHIAKAEESELVFTKLRNTVEHLYNRQFENMTHALEVLAELKKEGYAMVILTAGEKDIQKKRASDAGILSFMDAIHVYGYKTPDTLKEVLQQYPGKSSYVMIGNSLKSDIHPALENGIWGIHILRDTWEVDHYDVDQTNPLYCSISNLSEIPLLLQKNLGSQVHMNMNYEVNPLCQ